MARTVTVTVPSIPKLPRDYATTLAGAVAAVAVLVKQYMATGTITVTGVVVAAAAAVIGYYLPAKANPADELQLTEKITAVVQDLVAQQPALPDVESLVAEAVRIITAQGDTSNDTPADARSVVNGLVNAGT